MNESRKPRPRRKGFWVDVIFCASYPLAALSVLIINQIKRIDGGSSIGGKIENGKYYILTDAGTYKTVELIEWGVNLLVSCFTVLMFALGIVGFAYFSIKYLFYPKIKEMLNNSHNSIK